MSEWKCVLQLDHRRQVTDGSDSELVAAIARGADLRIYTEFRHNEHIDTASSNPELIREVAEFRTTYLLDRRWAAGIMTLRQPVELPAGFGPRPSMSFFLYNQDGQQAIARPYLDGAPAPATKGPSPLDDHRDMPRYHQHDNFDAGTNAPSSNFVYDFERFRYLVRDDWREVYACSSSGEVLAGSKSELVDAFAGGADVKVGIASLCDQWNAAPAHEVFCHTHSGYYYTDQGMFIAATQPLVRVAPGIPLRYNSDGWDFGWALVRTDGHVAGLWCDPYTLQFRRTTDRRAIRWFVR